MKLTELASLLHVSTQDIPDISFTQVSTDSRNLPPGALFIALQGENFNGHRFVEVAEQAGACAALVSEAIQAKIPLIRVKNTHHALMQLAAYHRQQMEIPITAITGSCGKTTTKNLVASIYSQCGKTLANIKSYNNNIGVPLTLLELTPEHQYAVTELGANHPGEIAELTQMVQPNIAVITNAAAAHLAGFGTIAGVAKAKGEIFQGLPEYGTAVINADDLYADFWKGLVGSRRIIYFALKNSADVYAREIQYNQQIQPSFQLILPDGTCHIQLQLMGEHNVLNALAAAAAAYAQGLPILAIQRGLEAVMPENKRLVETRGFRGAVIIDDSYNANPTSMGAAIQILAKRSGTTFLVMGDMLELGADADQYHQQIGEQAQALGINNLYCLGKHSLHAAKAFGKKAATFATHEQLIDAIKNDLTSDATVLIKGSRSMQMDRVAVALRNE